MALAAVRTIHRRCSSSSSSSRKQALFCCNVPSHTRTNFTLRPHHGDAIDVAKVLLVPKITRLEYEMARFQLPDGPELETKMVGQGSNYEHLKKRHDIHHDSLVRLHNLLRERDVHVDTTSRDFSPSNADDNYDAIFSVGGDGAFLEAAAKSKGSTPVIGMNSDPERSKGFLCLPQQSDTPIDAIYPLLEGNFKWSTRTRIRISLSTKAEDILALNDIFIGESTPFRSSYYELQTDDGPSERQKSSGIIVTTGSGSTGWWYNHSKITEATAKKILKIANCDASPAEVSSNYNASLTFPADEMTMRFKVRAPINNGIFEVTQHMGNAARINIVSRLWEGCIAADCLSPVAFNDSAVLTLQCLPEDALRTVSTDV